MPSEFKKECGKLCPYILPYVERLAEDYALARDSEPERANIKQHLLKNYLDNHCNTPEEKRRYEALFENNVDAWLRHYRL